MIANRAVKIELYVHTIYSADSLLPLWLLHLVCRIKHIDGVAITDHNRIDGAIRFRASYPDVFTIIGEEIGTAQGELIGLFLSEAVPAGLSVAETALRIQEQGGIACVPHPCDKRRAKTVMPMNVILENRASLHCIEGYNGRTLDTDDLKAQCMTGSTTGLPQVVGSDAHTWFELGRTCLRFPFKPENGQAFLNCLQNALPYITYCLPCSHFVTKLDRAVKLIMQGHFMELLGKCKRFEVRRNG